MKLRFFTDGQYREDKVLNWVGVGIFVFITAFVWMPKRDGLSTLYAIGFFLPMLCVLPFRKPEFKAYGGWISYLAIISAVYATLSSLWAPVSKPNFFIIQLLVLTIWLIGISWFASRRNIDWMRIQEYLLLSGALIGVIDILIFYGSYPLSFRLEGAFVVKNPNEIGALFGILTLLAFCQWLRVVAIRQSVHYGILIMILIAPLLLSQSRGACVALVMSCLIAVIYNRPSMYKLIFLIISTLSALGVFYYIVAIELAAERFAFGFRDDIWQEVFSRSLNEHLWLGLGMEKFEKIVVPNAGVFDHAHNVWLDTFYHTGLIGLVLAVVHVVAVLKKYKSTPSRIPLYLWLLFSLIVSMFDYRTFFWQIDFKWFLFWIPVGLISAIHIQEARMEVNSNKLSDTSS
jgi:O-antigen ligase